MTRIANLDKYLFVTDLDGTLLNDRRRISIDDFESLKQLRRMGCVTAVATGRSNYSLEQLFAQHDLWPGEKDALPVDYFIFSTGAGIMSARDLRILKSAALPLLAVREIIEIIDEFRVDYMVHRQVPYTREFLFRHHGGDNSDFQARLTLYRKYGQPLTASSVSQLDGATEVLCILPLAQARELGPKISEKLPHYSVIPATSPLDHRSMWIEIFAPTVSKSKALAWLAKELRIHINNVCAVGNDYNDEDMLSWAGSSFIVDNGPQSMKRKYTTVSSNNSSGVTEAVSRWLSNGGRGRG